jgi:ABC-type transporter Mla subunit MlaD
VAVIANIVALMQKEQAVWVGLLALFPLVLLLLTGLYLFALPYAAKWRSG